MSVNEWAVTQTTNNGWNLHKFHKFLQNSTQEELLYSQIPFFQAVEAFPRALALLASKIETSEERLLVIENLYEEHGNGNPAKFHTESFKTFLIALGWNGEHNINPWIDEWVENKLLSFKGKAAEYAAYLSGIEYAYAPISATIANHLDTLSLQCEQFHYSNHAELDWEHGHELLQVSYLINEKNKKSDIHKYFIQGQEDFLNLYEHILIPTSKEIAEYNKENISFYYTRENFQPEQKAIIHVADPMSKQRVSVLMIASGGEHLINHLSLGIPFDIDAIDMNKHQIELCKLKIDKLLNDEDISNKDDNYSGKFEKVFLLLREYMGHYTSMVDVDERANQKLKFAVDIIFSNKNLSLVFGERATQYTKESFSEHFFHVFKTMLFHKDLSNSLNILRGDDLIYSRKLREDFKTNFNKHSINWINNSFESLPVDKKYDIINISNIGDWMPIEDYRMLLSNLFSHINNNGVLIARKLLGDYDLKNELEKMGYSTKPFKDETQFYTETVLAIKNKDNI